MGPLKYREDLDVVTKENLPRITTAILSSFGDCNFSTRMLRHKSRSATKTLMVLSSNRRHLRRVVSRIKAAAAKPAL